MNNGADSATLFQEVDYSSSRMVLKSSNTYIRFLEADGKYQLSTHKTHVSFRVTKMILNGHVDTIFVAINMVIQTN